MAFNCGFVTLLEPLLLKLVKQLTLPLFKKEYTQYKVYEVDSDCITEVQHSMFSMNYGFEGSTVHALCIPGDIEGTEKVGVTRQTPSKKTSTRFAMVEIWFEWAFGRTYPNLSIRHYIPCRWPEQNR